MTLADGCEVFVRTNHVLEPPFSAARSQHLHNTIRHSVRIPHGVRNVTRFEYPRTSLRLGYLLAYQDPDTTGEHIDPHIVGMHMRRFTVARGGHRHQRQCR